VALFVRDERDLEINHQTSALRQMQDHVGERSGPILAGVAALHHVFLSLRSREASSTFSKIHSPHVPWALLELRSARVRFFASSLTPKGKIERPEVTISFRNVLRAIDTTQVT
jgi:hypothetical protein